MDLLTRQQLLATGYSGDEIDRMAANGTLVRVRRGLYASATGQPGSPEEEHLRRVRAVVAATRSNHVVSHVSAAIVRTLPVPTDALGRVHLTRERVGGGKRRGDVCIHTSPLPATDVGPYAGLLVTTPAAPSSTSRGDRRAAGRSRSATRSGARARRRPRSSRCSAA